MSSWNDVAREVNSWRAQRKSGQTPPVLGVSGAQGAGKSTFVARLSEAAGARIAAFSLDDVYLTKAERAVLARELHPLFQTRGPPGTHDVALFDVTLNALCAAEASSRTPLPRFDKLADERAPPSQWPVFEGRPDLILIDGWCLGAEPVGQDALEDPLNALEADEDADGVWRRAVNQSLRLDYLPRCMRCDAVIHLAAPDWETVARWRLEAERATYAAAKETPPADLDARMARFMAHYERITKTMMAGARRADLVVQLDADRRILGVDGALPQPD